MGVQFPFCIVHAASGACLREKFAKSKIAHRETRAKTARNGGRYKIKFKQSKSTIDHPKRPVM
jgi:hypothetical protein